MPAPIDARAFLPRAWEVSIACLLFATLSAAMFAFQYRAALIVFAICGTALVVIIVMAINKRVESQLHCENLPVKIGQQLRGYVAINDSQAGNESFWVVLHCTERSISTDNTSTDTIWQDELLVEKNGMIGTSGGVRIPFEFNMPTTGKATSNRVKWRLEVTSRGFAAEFPLTVIRTAASPTVPDEQLRPFSTVRDSLRH